MSDDPSRFAFKPPAVTAPDKIPPGDEMQAAPPATSYHVVNNRTGGVVGRYSTMKRARRAVDRHDNAYGGYAHSIRKVP